MVKLLPRLGKKKTGEVSIQDGKWKMEVKERFRLLGFVTGVFILIIAVAVIFFPYVVAALGLFYLIITVFMSGILDFMNWGRKKIWNGVKWVGKWCIKQPFLDFRYGRKKRKQMEDSKVYAE